MVGDFHLKNNNIFNDTVLATKQNKLKNTGEELQSLHKSTSPHRLVEVKNLIVTELKSISMTSMIVALS